MHLTFGYVIRRRDVLVQQKGLILWDTQVPNLNLFYSADGLALSLLFGGKELAAVPRHILGRGESWNKEDWVK